MYTAVTALAACSTSTSDKLHERVLHPTVNGLVQRAAMWMPLGWMMAVSIKLYRLARPATSVEATCLGSAAR